MSKKWVYQREVTTTNPDAIHRYRAGYDDAKEQWGIEYSVSYKHAPDFITVEWSRTETEAAARRRVDTRAEMRADLDKKRNDPNSSDRIYRDVNKDTVYIYKKDVSLVFRALLNYHKKAQKGERADAIYLAEKLINVFDDMDDKQALVAELKTFDIH